MSDLEETTNPLTPLDGLILALLAIMVVFSAAALGTVQPWSEQVFISLSTVLAFSTFVRIVWTRQAPVCGRLSIISLILFPVMIALQLIPMSAWTATVSPEAMRLREELAMPFAGSAAREGATVSLYAYETERQLRLLLSIISAFVAAAVVVTNRSAVRVLLMLIAGTSGVIAIIAATHMFLGIERIYGVVTRPPRAGETSAPFINRSHFAQYMNAGIGAAMALLLLSVSALRRQHAPRAARDWAQLLRQGYLHRLIFPATIVMLCAVSVINSASRGGIIALGAAAILAALVTSHRKSARGITWTFAVILLLGGIVTAMFSSRLQEKVFALAAEDATGGRWELLKAQVPIWRTFPATGVGFGSFEYVFPKYDLQTLINISSHAENEYAQVLTETGAPGLVLLLVFLTTVWLAWWRCIRHGGKRGLIASGLGFTLAAVTLHSALDFGQHLPANAIVTAIAAAALLRLGCPAAITGQERLPSRGWVVAGGMVMLLSAGLIWSCFAADRHRRAVAAMDESTRLADALGVARWQGSKADFDRMVASAAEAVSIAPRNAKAQYTLGVARFWSLMRERQARFDPAADARALNESLESFRAAAISAPLYGPPYSMAGQALGAFGKAEVGDALIETAAELSPQDGWTLALAGEARLRRGDPAGAMSRFRRAIGTSGIDPGYIIRRLLRVYDRVDLALELTGENQATLSEIAEYLRKQARHGEAAAVDDRIFTAAIRRAELSTASASALAHAARMLEKRGRNDEAITLYQRGLALDPQQHQWRLSVAKLLAAANQFAAAEREIRTILRDQPDWAEARVLGAEIRQRAATQPSQ